MTQFIIHYFILCVASLALTMAASTSVTNIAAKAEFDELLTTHPFIIADFYANWCPPCKAIAPLYAKLADQHGAVGKLAFAKINIDDVPDIAQAYNVTAMPTFLFFKHGKQAPVPVEAKGPCVVSEADGSGVSMIRGADPKSLTAIAAKLGELSKNPDAAAAPALAQADGNADSKPESASVSTPFL